MPAPPEPVWFYTFGLTSNSVLRPRTKGLLPQAVSTWDLERQRLPSRMVS